MSFPCHPALGFSDRIQATFDHGLVSSAKLSGYKRLAVAGKDYEILRGTIMKNAADTNYKVLPSAQGARLLHKVSISK